MCLTKCLPSHQSHATVVGCRLLLIAACSINAHNNRLTQQMDRQFYDTDTQSKMTEQTIHNSIQQLLWTEMHLVTTDYQNVPSYNQ